MLLSPSWRMRSLYPASRQISIPPRYAAYAMVLIMAISVNSYFDRVAEIDVEEGVPSGTDSDSGSPTPMSTTLLTETFSTTTQFTGEQWFWSDGSTDYYGIAPSNYGSQSSATENTFSGYNGDYLTGEDMDGHGSEANLPSGFSLPAELIWSVDVSGYTSLEFSGLFGAAFSNKHDGSDYLKISASLDGGSYAEILAFESTVTGSNGALSQDTDSDGIGDGTQLSSTLQTFTASISGTGTTLLLKLEASFNSGDEDFAADDFSVTGTAASGDCAAGQYSSDGQAPCTPCPAGSFQPYTGKSWCTTAWGGQYATGTGNTGQSACAAGSYSPTSGGASACTPCEAGKFQPSGAKSYCTLAWGGQYASGTGNTGTTDCVAGEYSSTSGGASACTPCAAGTYQPSAGKSWCSSALGGQYVSGTGATSQTPCAAGSYSPSSGGATSCTAVPADNYQDQAGMSWYTACPAGTSTSGATGSDEASDCA